MNKWSTIFLIIGILILGATTVSAQYSGTDFYSEKIVNFDVDITINKDGSFLVKENIVYNFGLNYKHGIYRDIPQGDLVIKVLKVIDKNGTPYIFKTIRENNNLRIKIGDPDETITGEHTYSIFYNVQNGLKYFSDHDELYWNITGNEWQIPINNSSVTVWLPENILKSNLQADCFTGIVGAKGKDCDFEISATGKVFYRSLSGFSAGEGLTIVLGWPKGIVASPTIFQNILWWASDFWPVLIPIFVFIFLFLQWWRRGRDFPLLGPIIAQYEPPQNLRPLEVCLIMKQKIKPIDISALIVDLAARGYIKIKEIKKTGFFGKSFLTEKDYELLKTKDFNVPNEDLQSYEKDFLYDIFKNTDAVLVSKLKNSFYTNINELINKVCAVVTLTGGYFTSDPKNERRKWASIATSLTAFIFAMAWFLSTNFLNEIFNSSTFSILILFGSILVSAALFYVFSVFMPKRTKKGAEAYWKILGFKEYINTAEKYRLQFQEKENIFEKFLPYAMIFGLAEKWGKAFEGIYNKPPSWYEGNSGAVFTASVFATNINHNLAAIGSAISSRPGGGSGSGFGGGGSSGGGGGGGGGGSW